MKLTPDLINGLFELIGSVVTFYNCRIAFKDKQVHGLSISVIFFFLLWGFWNLYYYPHLEQVLSFYAGILLVIGNLIYVWLLFYYKIVCKNQKGVTL